MDQKAGFEEFEQRVRELERTDFSGKKFLNVPVERDEHGNAVYMIGNHEEITDRKRAEKEHAIVEEHLLRAQKIEAIATLTSGIAHDYNNLLTIIIGNLSLIMERVGADSELAYFVNEVNEAALKVRDLTHELMSLSSGGAAIKKLGSVKKILKSALTEVPVEADISFEDSISADLWPVPHDPNKLRAVFRNVVQNAVESMSDGGFLVLKAQNLRVEDGDVVPGLSVKPGDYVRVSIQDNGCGVSEENLDKIFDPYFSTKPMGVQKGMGLGLATAHAIVKKHGGDIIVQSTPHVGTTVTIYLPAMPTPRARQTGLPAAGAEKKPPGPARNETEAQSSIDPSGTGYALEKHASRFTGRALHTAINRQSPIQRILLMDDEGMLRNITRQMLNRLGYEVETVEDGVEALDVYKKHLDLGKSFDAVILDLTIKGGMGGEQTLQGLLKIDPNIKAIIASGYIDDLVMAEFQDYGFRAAMAKPYEMKDLKGALEMVLS